MRSGAATKRSILAAAATALALAVAGPASAQRNIGIVDYASQCSDAWDDAPGSAFCTAASVSGAHADSVTSCTLTTVACSVSASDAHGDTVTWSPTYDSITETLSNTEDLDLCFRSDSDSHAGYAMEFKAGCDGDGADIVEHERTTARTHQVRTREAPAKRTTTAKPVRPPLTKNAAWRVASALAAALTLGTTAQGAETVLTLKSAVALALERNRALFSERLGREMQRSDLAVAESERGLKWTIAPYAETGRRRGGESRPDVGTRSRLSLPLETGGELSLDWRVSSGLRGGGEERYESQADLVLRQPLLEGRGKEIATAGVAQARLRDEMAELGLERARSATVRQVLARFRTHTRAKLELGAREESLERSKELLALNRILVESGQMAARDVVQAQSGVARQELALVSAEYQGTQTRSALLELLDLNTDEDIRIEFELDLEGFEPKRENAKVEDVVHAALRARPEYTIAESRVEAARLAYRSAKDGARWSLDLVFGAGIEGLNASLGGALKGAQGTGYSAGVELEIPLSANSRRPANARSDRARIALERARNEAYLVRERIRLELDDALRTLDLTYRRIELARAARRLVEEKTRIEREKLESGLSSNFQLLSFEDERLNARQAEIGAVFAHMEAQTRFVQARGTLVQDWTEAKNTR